MQDPEPGSVDSIATATDSGWDVDAQVSTLKEAAAASKAGEGLFRPGPPPPRASKGPPPLPKRGAPRPAGVQSGGAPRSTAPPAVRPHDALQPEGLVEQLRARAGALEATGDRIGLSRTHVELAIVLVTLFGDQVRARTHAEAALRADPGATAAHALVRRLMHARSAASAMLEHVESELAAASTDGHRVKLFVEKAQLLEAVGGRARDARTAWEHALAIAPMHPGALKGLEGELIASACGRGSAADWAALAEHLGRMSEAYSEQRTLSAWLQVERARILERRLDDRGGARAALERAVALEPAVGPVRDALVRHLGVHADWPALAFRLEEHAKLDSSSARAARFELDAATIITARLSDETRALSLLERAAARAPSVASVDRRVLDELVRLSEAEGRWADAARARRARLRFMTDPSILAYELRALATAAERQGDADTAIVDLQRALGIDATDPALVDSLDRLLRAAGKHEQRIAAWLQEAARTQSAPRRADALVRAARICEDIGRVGDAIRHLRSAWVAAPASAEVLDGLARLLAPRLPELLDQNARSLVELYTTAAEQADDEGRKVAYLERVALLWEEVLCDSARAARVYEAVLALEPDRRSAIIGLARTAARLGEHKTLSRALLDEARVTTDRAARLTLRTRAAGALASEDAARAAALVREVLEEEPKHREARALETRLHENEGRFELAARSLRARAESADTPADKVALWLALAHLQGTRLGSPLDALASLDRARLLDPTHPVPPEETARVLEGHGEARPLREAVERLASSAQSREERARHLGRAAEIDELRLGDDPSAARTYQRALAETPDDDLLADRLARVTERRLRGRPAGELAELSALHTKRLERASSPSASRAMAFDLALLLVDTNQEPARAASLLEALLSELPDDAPALRTLEWLRRASSVEAGPIARVLASEAEAFTDTRARLGSLWALAALQEWALPAADLAPTYRAILALDPSDTTALEATLRLDMADARLGDGDARTRVLDALRALVSKAPSNDVKQSFLLSLALLLEVAAGETSPASDNTDLVREALGRYRDALRIDELSTTAAGGLARIAGRLGDVEASLDANIALAEIAATGSSRARFLIEGAEILLGHEPSPGLGEREARRGRAVHLLERALDADPESTSAAGRLATLAAEDQKGDRLVPVFRAALSRARAPEAIVMLGSEIARVARDDLRDLPLAIDAMRQVRAAAPEHVPSLFTLAELCIAQRVWPDAVDALESIVAVSRDTPPKLTALFALASIYEKVLARPAEVDRVLRAALALEPKNVRALRALVRRLSAGSGETSSGSDESRRREMASMLERLGEIETDAERKTAILLELSEVLLRQDDPRGAERALVEAVAHSPDNLRAFSRLSNLFRESGKLDVAGFTRALTSLLSLGERLGRVDGRWWAARGQLLIEPLGRIADGASDLQRATDLDPSMYATRLALAEAYVKVAEPAKAAETVLRMLSPAPHPLLSVADPTRALAVLDDALGACGRAEDAVVVSELRSLSGSLDEGRRAWLASRHPGPLPPQPNVIDRATLVSEVLPAEGRSVFLDVSAAIAGVEPRLGRNELTDLGIGSRDRLKGGHPTRALLDRLLRQFAVADVELAVSPKIKHLRVLGQDVPWIVVSPLLVARPEPVQLVALARAVARLSLGVPWLDDVPTARVESLLHSAARLAAPTFARSGRELGQDAPPSIEPALARALNRRQRKQLDELAPKLTQDVRLPSMPEWVEALVRAELRAAFVVVGELLAIVSEQADRDVELQGAIDTPGMKRLAAVLNHPLLGDTSRFALTPQATALRVRMGARWTP